MNCAAHTGFLLARRCERPSLGACRRCETEVCRDHAYEIDEAQKPPKVLCWRCYRQTQPDDSSYSTSSGTSSSSSSSPSSRSEPFTGQGGAFGGGGASSSWDAPATRTAAGALVGSAAADAAFDDADFAAFDDVSDFDKNAGNDAYDS